jgi:hypothetical protein
MTAEAPTRGVNVQKDIAPPPQNEPADPLVDIRTRFAREIEILSNLDLKENPYAQLLFTRYVVANGISVDTVAKLTDEDSEDVQTGLDAVRNPNLLQEWKVFLKTLGLSPEEEGRIVDAEIVALRTIQPKVGLGWIAGTVGLTRNLLSKTTRRLIEEGHTESFLHPKVKKPPLPPTFFRIPIKRLSDTYDCSSGYLRIKIKEFAKLHPEHFIKRGRGGTHNANKQGMALVMEFVEKYKLPLGFASLHNKLIAQLYKLSKAGVDRYIKEAIKTTPDHFITRPGRLPVLADASGIQILKELLDKNQERYNKQKPPSGADVLRPIPMYSTGKSLGYSKESVRKVFNELASLYPDDFKKTGVDSGTAYLATAAGEEKLYERLSPPAGYTRFRNLEELYKSLGVSGFVLKQRIKQINGALPNSIIFAEIGRVDINQNGLTLLEIGTKREKRLPGYQKINVGEAAERNGLSLRTTHNRIRRLRMKFPDHIKIDIAGKRAIVVSSQGEKLINEALAKK